MIIIDHVSLTMYNNVNHTKSHRFSMLQPPIRRLLTKLQSAQSAPAAAPTAQAQRVVSVALGQWWLLVVD